MNRSFPRLVLAVAAMVACWAVAGRGSDPSPTQPDLGRYIAQLETALPELRGVEAQLRENASPSARFSSYRFPIQIEQAKPRDFLRTVSLKMKELLELSGTEVLQGEEGGGFGTNIEPPLHLSAEGRIFQCRHKGIHYSILIQIVAWRQRPLGPGEKGNLNATLTISMF